jgi:hypothetical protein
MDTKHDDPPQKPPKLGADVIYAANDNPNGKTRLPIFRYVRTILPREEF